MQFFVNSASPIAAAVKHALTIVGVPETSVATRTENFGVEVESRTYSGLQPLLRALRTAVSSEEHRQFLGCASAEQALLVNQWVGVAALLSASAASAEREAAAKAIYADVEREINMAGLKASFLAGTPRATIADVLLYSALFQHPDHAAAQPQTVAWATHVARDAYLAAVKSSNVPAQHGQGAKQGGGGGTSAYVKPSEEEIARRRQEKEAAKKAKEAAAAAKGEAPAAAKQESAKKGGGGSAPKAAPEVSSSLLDIRVGRFTNLKRHPDADRLYVEEMDLGTETRTIVSGLVEHYTEAELENSLCLVVFNMKAKPLKGITSQGMVLCASTDSAVRLVRPPADAAPGTRVTFGAGYDAELAATVAAVPSGKQMTEVLSHLHTDAEGNLCWKDEKAHLASGVIAIPEMKNCIVK